MNRPLLAGIFTGWSILALVFGALVSLTDYAVACLWLGASALAAIVSYFLKPGRRMQ